MTNLDAVTSWLADHLVGFSPFRGPRPGGHFLQDEAWQGRQCCVESTARAIGKAIDE